MKIELTYDNKRKELELNIDKYSRYNTNHIKIMSPDIKFIINTYITKDICRTCDALKFLIITNLSNFSIVDHKEKINHYLSLWTIKFNIDFTMLKASSILDCYLYAINNFFTTREYDFWKSRYSIRIEYFSTEAADDLMIIIMNLPTSITFKLMKCENDTYCVDYSNNLDDEYSYIQIAGFPNKHRQAKIYDYLT